MGVLDAPGKAIGKTVRSAVSPGPVKDALSGTWLGHALHPLLTDVTIGSLLSASLLDVLGGKQSGRGARRLLLVGVISYPATVATGINDWADTEIADARVRRVGLLHAAANTVGFACYASSLAARSAGRTGRGKLLALAGLGAMSVGGYLGAHMSFILGVGPNQAVFDQVPEEWTAVADAADLEDGTPTSVVAGDTPVLLLRHGDGLHALHDRCSHRGCPLSEGELDGESVTCFCHGSRFDLRDGSVQRGPATAAQPVYDARELDGRIEVRARPGG
jgi:nitrite reductase/ring-hydroxylating ferredoxin subunit